MASCKVKKKVTKRHEIVRKLLKTIETGLRNGGYWRDMFDKNMTFRHIPHQENAKDNLQGEIKMVSEKQEQANIQNAQLSTGPVSLEGKSVVARNALKHGIFAKDLVIAVGDGQEDAMEYHELMADLKKDLVPAGRMEMLLVEKIAVNYWRLRRLVRYETGETRERLDHFKEKAISAYYKNSYMSKTKPNMEYFDYGDKISDGEHQDQVYRVAALNSSHYDLTADKVALEYTMCHRLHIDEEDFSEVIYRKARKYIQGLSPQLRGKLRRELLDEAEQMLEEMEEVRSWELKFDRLHKSNSLPLERDLNKIIKYEKQLERSIFRNLAALKTLQDNRPIRDEGDNEILL